MLSAKWCQFCLSLNVLPENNWKCKGAYSALKHQAISIHRADWTVILLDQLHTEILVIGTILENKIILKKKVFLRITVKSLI